MAADDQWKFVTITIFKSPFHNCRPKEIKQQLRVAIMERNRALGRFLKIDY